MYHPDQFNIAIIDTPADPSPSPMRSVCLVDGCPRKDARIVSHRRAAFFAAIARRTGETADRIVPAESSWAFAWDATLESERSQAVVG